MSKNNDPVKDRYYIAYGSNLNLEQMAGRCPTAEIVQAAYLHNYRLMFRGKSTAAATVEKHKGGKVPVLIWQLQPGDERSLDAYEGCPRLYHKETLRMTVNGRRTSAMIYIMNGLLLPYGTPSRSYFETIRRGYEDSGFDTRILRHAILDSVWEEYLAEKYKGGEGRDGNDQAAD